MDTPGRQDGVRELASLGDARAATDRDIAMGRIARAIHDGIRRRTKASISRCQANASPIRGAIAEFAGAHIANECAARHAKGEDK
jgi:hypothetical protein